MGLLGGNIFGVSSIQQVVFVNNTPNCEIVFFDGHSPAATPVLRITDSLFMLGAISSANYLIAAGLNIKLCIMLKVALEMLLLMAILAIYASRLAVKMKFK